MMIELPLLLTSAIFLAYSSNWFTDGASKLAKGIGVSNFMIGLSVVAIGTSLPEIAISAYSSLTGASGIAIGNVIGSNITNIALILGIAAILRPIVIDTEVYRDARIHVLLLAVTSCWFLYSDAITRPTGLLLILAYLWYIRDGYRRHRSSHSDPEVAGCSIPRDLAMPLLQTAFGAAGVLVACSFLIDAATSIASELGVSDTAIGLTLVALGTSLPELAVSVTAARKGHGMMVLGNVIGSNIANILLALGAGASIRTIPLTDSETITTDLVLMVFLAMAMIFFMRYRGVIDRRGGFLFVMAYVTFAAMVFM